MDQFDVCISESSVLAEIQRIVSTTPLGIKREINSSDELVKDLDLDSVDMITLAVAIESHFNIAIPEEESLRIRSVGDLCHVVTRAVRSRC
jgi:acyl carrier protein